jgi:hypothetical protein
MLFRRHILCVVGHYGMNSNAAAAVYLNVSIFGVNLQDSKKGEAQLHSTNRYRVSPDAKTCRVA